MIILGIVGNPASGKSTVCEYLQSLGGNWINADLIARDILQSDTIRDALLQRFGEAILTNTDEGEVSVDRAALASLVFGEDEAHRTALEDLEAIVHPPTRLEIHHRLVTTNQQECPLAVLDVPLLFDSKWDLACDGVWCVDAPRGRRESWAAERGWTPEDLKRREWNQRSLAEKRRLSTNMLQNEGSLGKLRSDVDSMLKNLGISDRL